MKDWTPKDMDVIEREIRAAVPDVIIDRTGDFGFAMVAIRSDKSGAITVFIPESNMNPAIATPVQDVISFLRPS